ncbi:MAG: hypothetical protein KGL46_05210 [Hyphomicrobiales bacterium]|nr:hypothetical protein [Hyphomicrobiales bacterium]
MRRLLAALFIAGAATGAQAQIMKVCADEWAAAKASGQAAGATWPDFLAQCRVAHANDGLAPAPQPQLRPVPAPQPQYVPPAPPAPAAEETGRGRYRKAGEFQTPQAAAATCPGDTVVWVNTRSGAYHFAGSAAYGATKHGGYMCERAAQFAGAHAAKREEMERQRQQ